jgi:excinuclease UvrABC nuclease subunit
VAYDSHVEPSQRSFTHTIAFSPEGDFDVFLKQVPARWVVYLLTDAEDRPVQLLCVRNLRQSLKRRLGGSEQVGPSRRVNYREIIRFIHYRRVDSSFESDWIYYEAARDCFPRTYQGMVGFRPAWFVQVDPEAQFPRYVKTIDLTPRAGMLLGPLEDKHAAARLIQSVEDGFDLCRFYNIMVESPFGKACAYKEMGKCPAPCDGSISLGQYRRMIEWSLSVLTNPGDFVREETARMQQAAGELRFETAGKINGLIRQVNDWSKGAFRFVRPIGLFRMIAIQRGPREGTAKIFLILPGVIEEVAAQIDAGRGVDDLVDIVQQAVGQEESCPAPPASIAAERIGIVAHHLFMAKQTSGVFMWLQGASTRAIAQGLRDIQKQKLKEAGDEEGLERELQAL